MKGPIKCELVNWDQVVRFSSSLAEQIRRDGYVPDIVIAIARGGYVPARLVCDHLDIYNLTSIRISHYTAGCTRFEQARLSMPLCVDVKDMQVLVVDDVDDSGDTLGLALEHISTFRPSKIKTAVLHHKKVSSLMPDYYAEPVIQWRWITYPWAVYEDISGFIANMTPPPASVEEAKERLEKENQVHFSNAAMQAVYNFIGKQTGSSTTKKT